ncbi:MULTISPECIES: ABC transporter permease [unclassified Chelatococcus]|uniref:ABC transporter permease n=1 Tax=unclassified Chelatococcus TaxID=2638111 RepID=UPI001BCAADF6|nr:MULTISPECIES: ABC transporter permease [unclassified Chelatococcus]CAH1651463.1 putative spermidine/putrescine transport system permease protein [Hyphomicrobiales bacterium]MBS7743167.1 ABC transporter permease [Chelatococcus sp. HY11]MBX3541715.1 ABC transporter permease [Chelatococcus sp.]MCO5074393.1 ABC transporter permease [Chelatococcus sp.]CAH1693257.1 putative spermidine/putrescine transport system permease protein [Hyphomicrobiales bacterium]
MVDPAARTLAAARPRREWRRRAMPWLLLAPSLALMLYAFVLPMLTFFEYSFYTFRRGKLIDEFSLATYRRFLFDAYYQTIVFDTLWMAALTTVLALAIGYPLAFALWRLERPWMKRWLSLIIFSPIIVSVVVRSYGWIVLLADQGPVNWVLKTTGLAAEPVTLVFNLSGVVLSLAHVFLPFVVFPIYSSMSRIDPALREAAMDLGAGWLRTFRSVTLPLTLPGVVAAVQIAFTLALGAFVTPAMLGGGRVLVLPLQVYNATAEINWPVAAVGGLVLLVIAIIVVALCNRLLKYSEA